MDQVVLVLITFVAATVNGALGYGFSRVLTELNLATAFTTYSILMIVTMLNAYLLFRYFRDRTVP